jgi:hypothetical protein
MARLAAFLVIEPAIFNDVRTGPKIYNGRFHVVAAKAITGIREDFHFGYPEQIAFHGKRYLNIVRAAIVRGISMDNVDREAFHCNFHLIAAAPGILIVIGSQTGARQASAV